MTDMVIVFIQFQRFITILLLEQNYFAQHKKQF